MKLILGFAVAVAAIASGGAHAATLVKATTWGSNVNYYDAATNASAYVMGGSYEQDDLTTGAVIQRGDNACVGIWDGANGDSGCGPLVTDSDLLGLQGTITGTVSTYSGATITVNLTYIATHIPGSAPYVDAEAVPSAGSPSANASLGSARMGRVSGTITHSTLGTMTFDFNATGSIYTYSTVTASP